MKIQSKLFLYSKSITNLSPNSQFCASFVKPSCRRRPPIRSKRWIFVSGITLLILVATYLHFFTGIFYPLFVKDFCSGFEYPEDIQDFPQFIKNYKYMENTRGSIRKMLTFPTPTNNFYSSVEFPRKADFGCSTPLGILIVVKSAAMNFEKRVAVRSTWGDPLYLKNTSISEDLPTKLVFIVGQPANDSISDLEKEDKLAIESQIYDDTIFATFIDTYNNNTYKSMSALRWAKEYCSDFRYLFLVDDDMFVSLRNLVQYLKNPITYEKRLPHLREKYSADNIFQNASLEDFYETNPLYKDQLMMGMLILTARPMRNQYGWNSKWFVSLTDYPYNYFPPYVPGMATVLSKSTVIDFVYASLFTRHLYIDDVYFGILAYKLQIKPRHTDYFIMLDKWNRTKTKWTDYMIAVHSYRPNELVKLWSGVKE